MERVSGIGGFFFRAKDPRGLADWYEQALGIGKTPGSMEGSPWWQDEGPTVFEPFPADTDYFGSPQQNWMLNLRVRDLDAMVAQLTGLGVAVTVDPQAYPYGRFARLHDPEGNPIELWQPMEMDSAQADSG